MSLPLSFSISFQKPRRIKREYCLQFSKEKIEKYIHAQARWLSACLMFGYAASILASLVFLAGQPHYFFFLSLFSHFTIQYMIGGFILGVAFLALRAWKRAAVCLVICVMCFAESRINLHHPWQFSPEGGKAVYKIALYNHNVGITRFGPLPEFLSSENEKFDIVILQEANADTVRMSESLQEIYPYQIHEPRGHSFGMVVLSRYPFLEDSTIALDGPYYPSFAVRVVVQPPAAQNPLVVYTFHPHPPTSVKGYGQRDFELMQIAARIREDSSKNIIMLGDWNITPFDSAFTSILKKSGLHYQSYGLLLNPTWPTFNAFSFLKIPIDHALYSENLMQLEKRVVPHMVSDHHALVVSYAEK